MKKKYVVLVLILMLVFLGSIALMRFNRAKTLKEDVALKNSIIDVMQRSKEIDFSKVTNFEWDTMYLFTPYLQPKDILEKDGITTNNSKFSIEVLDSINMIGFVKANKLVAYVELPRSYGGSDLNNYIKFTKAEAKFNILQDKKAIDFKKN